MGEWRASGLSEAAGILSCPGGCDSDLAPSASASLSLSVDPPGSPPGRPLRPTGERPRRFFSLVYQQTLCWSLSACAEEGGGSGGRVSDIATDDMEFWRRNLRERSEPELLRG